MYLYFDYKGTLLEIINDEALRQYNKGVNMVNIYIESAPDSVTGIVPDDGKIPSYITGIQYWFQLANGDKLNDKVYDTSSKIKKTIPFDRNRDLRHFRYGKSYEFFSFQVPSGDYKKEKNDNVIDFVGEGDVFKSSGLVLMTVQARTAGTNADGTPKDGALSLERVAFTVEDAVILPDDIVNTSEFNWLLQQYAFGDYLRAQLVYMKVDKITASHAFTIDGDKYSIDLDTNLFNRIPKIGDAFLYVYENGADKESNITMAVVDKITGDVTECSFSISNTISIKGEKGDTGEIALAYMKEIDEEFVVDTTIPLETGWFSRLPNATELFVAFNTYNQYALLYVQGEPSSNGTNVRPVYVVNTKGDTGATPNIAATASVSSTVGTPSVLVSRTGNNENPNFRFDFLNLKGETGKDYLVGASPTTVDSIGFGSQIPIAKNAWNRTPSVGEYAIAILNPTYKGTWIVYGTIDSVVGSDTILVVSFAQNITGATGAQGERGVVGPKGRDALVYNAIFASSFEKGEVKGAFLSDFNRTPFVGETFVGFSSENQYAELTVTSVETSSGVIPMAYVTPSKIVNTQGASGEIGPIGPESLIGAVSNWSAPGVGGGTNIAISAFNRTPSVGESAIVIFNEDSITSITCGTIDSINNEITVAFTVSYVQNITGQKGDTGEACIILGRLIFGNEPVSGRTFEFEAGYSDFSRSPNVGDMFICEYSANQKGYLCICELTAINKNLFTASFEAFIDSTGPRGKTGEQGLTGQACLILKKLISGGITPEYYQTFEFSAFSSDFSRSPIVGDAFVCEYSVYGGGGYLCICELTAINENLFTARFVSFVDAKGQKGDIGETGVGISVASVKSTSETEEYTSTTVSLLKTDNTTSEVVIKAKNGINPNTVSFIGTVEVSDWQDSTAYSAYGYKYSALMPFTGGVYATDTYVPDVVPSAVADVVSGNFAPFANSLSTGVQIYAKSKPIATKNFNVSLSHVQQ